MIGNGIRTEGAKAISDMLKVNATLTSFNMGCEVYDNKRKGKP